MRPHVANQTPDNKNPEAGSRGVFPSGGSESGRLVRLTPGDNGGETNGRSECRLLDRKKARVAQRVLPAGGSPLPAEVVSRDQ